MALLPDNPYGFTVENKATIPAAELTDIINMGANWVRPQTNWGLMETTDDGHRGSTLSSVIDWTHMDAVVAQCNANGLRVCLPIQNPPLWHCTQGVNVGTQIPNPLDTIAFGTALIQRYSGGAHGIIQAVMFNEDWDAYSAGWPLGTGGSLNPSYTSRDFAPLGSIFPTLYPIIKAANPTCLVGCASILGKRTDATHIGNLVSSLWSSGCGGFIDFLDIHFYNCASPPTLANNNLLDPPLADRLAAIKAANAAAGHANMDIWMTELGYQVNNGGTPVVCDVTSAQQSAYLIQSIDIGKAYGVSHFFLWTIGGNDNNSLTQGTGTGKTYMPAYGALKDYIAQGTTGSGTSTGLSVRSGHIVDSSGKTLRLRGLNAAGLEFGNGLMNPPITQARVNAFAQLFSMNLWRVSVNVSWWNNNVLMTDGVTLYQDWIQQIIGWMKAAGNYVEIDPTTWATIPPANSGPYCNNPPITTVDSDTFTRANQSGWGTASGGGTWSLSGPATLSIASNEGVLSGTGGSNAFVRIGSNTATDLEIQARFALTNSNHVYSGAFLRFSGTDDCYIAYADTAHLYLAKRVGGVQTNLATVTKTFTSGTFYQLKFWASGTQLTVKAWNDSVGEPDPYDIQLADSSLTSGFYGLYSFDTAGGDSVQFDHYVASVPQTACIIAQNTQTFPPWTEAQITAAFVSFFQSFVPLYVNDPAILYDAMNEPGYFGGPATVADNNTVINAIRTIHPNSLIFVYDVGTNNTNPGASYAQPNLVFDFHVYDGSPTWQTQLAWWTTPGVIASSMATTIGEWNANTTNDPNGFGKAVANVALTRGVANSYYNADNLLQSDNITLTAQGLIVQSTFQTIALPGGTYTVVIGGQLV